MKLREVFFKDINETINASIKFGATDFDITTRDSKDDGIVASIEIKYIYEDKFVLKILVPSSKSSYKVKDKYGDDYNTYSDYQFELHTTPGEFIMDENFKVWGRNKMLKSIESWLSRIWEELQALPINREINNIKEQVEKLHNKYDSISEEYFTDQETEEIESKLDDLHKKIEDQIKNQKITEEELKSKIQTLNEEISSLKATVNVFNKKNWFKSFTSKVFKWSSDPTNKSLIKNGVEIVKNFLPEETQGMD